MWITKKFALRKTRMHSDDTVADDPTGVLPYIDVKAYAPKGTIYYQISNGTIGRGARYRNYSEQAMAELMSSTATAWKQGIGRVNQEHVEVDHNLLPFPVKKEEEYDIDADTKFTYADIPF